MLEVEIREKHGQVTYHISSIKDHLSGIEAPSQDLRRLIFKFAAWQYNVASFRCKIISPKLIVGHTSNVDKALEDIGEDNPPKHSLELGKLALNAGTVQVKSLDSRAESYHDTH